MQQKNHRSISLLLFWKCFLLICLPLWTLPTFFKIKNVWKIKRKNVTKKRKKTFYIYVQKQNVNVLFTTTPSYTKSVNINNATKKTSRFHSGPICGIWCRDTITIILNLFASILTHTDVRSRMHLDILTWYRLHFITSCWRCEMYLDRLSSTNIAQVRSSTSCRYQARQLDLCFVTDVQCQWKQPTSHHDLDSHYLHQTTTVERQTFCSTWSSLATHQHHSLHLQEQ